ncbi:MAG: DUF2252 domain-containing protein [Elainella sp.]
MVLKSRFPQVPTHLSLDEQLAMGKALRDRVPRSSHADWQPRPDRPDPITLLEQSSQDRISSLIPIRYGRMSQSAFAFLRGAASIMTADLAQTPNTGILVQSCGDCHISNFGGYGTPERNLVFDVNDFDETLAAPWEWDLKRLAASAVVASRLTSLSSKQAEALAEAVACSYRTQIRSYAEMPILQLWYAHLDDSQLLKIADSAAARKQLEKTLDKARTTSSASMLPKLTEQVDGRRQIIDQPPLVGHTAPGEAFEQEMAAVYDQYCQNVRNDLKALLGHYQLVDIAMKVVGVGSVGLRCAILLLMAGDDPLFLQIKQSRQSVLEPFLAKSQYSNQGQRVVTGQRLMQATSDIFLGWASSTAGPDGLTRDFYVRQLRDMKLSIDLSTLSADELVRYGKLCASALARAHARSGKAALISGYLGDSDKFDRALAQFALAYAEQTERDYAALVAAVQSGRLSAEADSGKPLA